MCKAPSVGSKSNKLLLSWLPWTSKRMIKLCNVEEGGETGERERTRSLGPKRNSSTTGTTGDHVSEQAWVSCSPCVCWTRGPWIWTWSACLPLSSMDMEWNAQNSAWRVTPRKALPLCLSFPINMLLWSIFTKQKQRRKKDRERKRERPKPTMLALKWQIFMQKKVISSLEGRTLTDIQILT